MEEKKSLQPLFSTAKIFYIFNVRIKKKKENMTVTMA